MVHDFAGWVRILILMDNIKKIDEPAARALEAADQIRAGKRSAPQHWERADLEVLYSITQREHTARLGRVEAYACTVEIAIEGLATEVEMIRQSRGIR